MRIRHVILLIAFVAAAAPTAGAETPGPQALPPGPGPTRLPPLVHDLDQRRAIRGCPVGEHCHSELDSSLREFEREAFGRNHKTPWIDSHQRQRPSRVARANARPSSLRPDLRWLDSLTLPDIPVRWDDRLIKYLEFYKNDPRGRNIMTAWLKAQGRYRELILEHLRKAGLPEDLLYVAMIESSYDASEYSRVGASGLWQFMPAGGRIYGLEAGRWVDERNDPLRSTQAAVHYWRDLYERFGDWHLAMAAYNAGYGAVLRSIAKYNTNDFWQLLNYENALPWESSLYVPKALAAAIVGHNRKFFGYDDVEAYPAIQWDTVTVPKSVPLSVVARAAGTKQSTIELLNPHLRRGRTPPGAADFAVRVPRGSGQRFASSFAQLQGDWDKYDAYVVAHGERFEDIATMHGVSRAQLRKLNDIDTEAEVRGGMVLVVPKVDAANKKKNLAKAKEDLYASGVPKGNPGDKLIVALPDPDAVVPGKKRIFYRVVTGDSLYGIGTALDVDYRSLARWNGLALNANLYPQMVLTAWVSPSWNSKAAKTSILDPRRVIVTKRGSAEHIEMSEERLGRQRIEYTAQRRESLASIGKKYGLTDRDLARINQLSPSTVLEPGQQIVVYQVIDRLRSDRAMEQSRQAPRKPAPKSRKTPLRTAKKGETKASGGGSKAVEQPQPAEAQPAEAQPAEAQPAEAQPAEAQPAEPKPAEPKPAEPKPAEPKSAEPKSAESKPAESKPAEPKPAESKPAEPKLDHGRKLLDTAPPDGPKADG